MCKVLSLIRAIVTLLLITSSCGEDGEDTAEETTFITGKAIWPIGRSHDADHVVSGYGPRKLETS